MRALTPQEQKNALYLAGRDIEFAFLLPTSTGLKKSILDAVQPLREYLLRKQIHDYSSQPQGSDGKRVLKALVVGSEIVSSKASLYRPVTKKGDPRIWFRGLGSQVKPNDMLAVVADSDTLYAVDLTGDSFSERIRNDSEFSDLLDGLQPDQAIDSIAMELLQKMKQICRNGFIPAECSGSTAIGRTLESALGLTMNSSPLPDYKGIEIKSKRRISHTRKTLFAKVPDWELSSLNSFRELLDWFGYDRNGLRRLNCTVSALQRNPQGLTLTVDDGFDLLIENGERVGAKFGKLLVWKFSDLKTKLEEKHRRTFWVDAKVRRSGTHEEFLFERIEYTRTPHAYRFPELIGGGFITVDHLIKARGESAHERGPLFKVNSPGFGLLFPPAIRFDLKK